LVHEKHKDALRTKHRDKKDIKNITCLL